MCAAGWLAKGQVGYPIVKPGSNCGFGKTGIVDYGFRLNRSEKWDAYCYNPNGMCEAIRYSLFCQWVQGYLLSYIPQQKHLPSLIVFPNGQEGRYRKSIPEYS